MKKKTVTFQDTEEIQARTNYADWRDANQDKPASASAEPDMLSDSQGFYAIDEATKEVQARVRSMLEQAKQVLTVQQYNAFILIDLKKLKVRQAARVMELHPSRVQQLIVRARLKLQQVYNERT